MASKGASSIERKEKVGEGGFGVVYRGRYGNTEVAIKDINVRASADAIAEAELLKELQHQNIIRYIDVLHSRDQLSLIMEFVDGGDLMGYIRRTAQGATYWKTTRDILTGVAHGMSYLHRKSIVHADLKSLNVLLWHDYRAVICDFGLAQTIASASTCLTGSVGGTRAWFAPELCSSPPERNSCPSDVWAFGCIILEITSRRIPWAEQYPNADILINALSRRNSASTFEGICRAQTAPEDLKNILCRCCAWQKRARPTFPDIVTDLTSIVDLDPHPNMQNPKKPPAKRQAKPSTTRSDSASADSGFSSASTSLHDNLQKLLLDKPSSKSSEDKGSHDEESGRVILVGPRGGKYYISSSGKKVFVK